MATDDADAAKQPDLMSNKDVPEGEMERLQKSLSDSDARESDEKKQ